MMARSNFYKYEIFRETKLVVGHSCIVVKVSDKGAYVKFT